MINVRQHLRRNKQGKVIEVQPHLRANIIIPKAHPNVKPIFIELPELVLRGKYDEKFKSLNYSRLPFTEMNVFDKKVIKDIIDSLGMNQKTYDLKNFTRLLRGSTYYDIHYNKDNDTFDVFRIINNSENPDNFSWFHHKKISRSELRKVIE